jgi:hexosaminidase
MMTNSKSSIFFLRFTITAIFLTQSVVASAQNVSILPVPASLKKGNGNFELTASTTVSFPGKSPDVSRVAGYLTSIVKTATGFELKSQAGTSGNIQLALNDKTDAAIGKEGYSIDVSPSTVIVKANTSAGLFYGCQTLLQLLPKEIESKTVVNAVKWAIPSVAIVDYPRFGWRGIMLDVSRHFFSKEYVKEYIDQLARYKFNRLHLHLTDDQGWRVEIKSFPKLTTIGSKRVQRYGTWGTHDAPKPGEPATDAGFYTQEDIKEIVQYAKDRFIEVVPEIDVPGHSMAAIAAYPELCVTNDTTIRVNPGSNFSKWFGRGKFEMYIDNTLDPTDEKVYAFLDKVFAEIAQLFPFEYIHMGGDECYKGYWERDPGVQEFMKKNKIKDSHELQAYFNKRVNKIITSKGKKTIGWDEILEGGIASDAAVMSWRGTKGGIEASQQKHTVVMSPSPLYYLDMVQGESSIEPKVYDKARLRDVYNFNILPKEIDSTYVLGGQGNLWTEQIVTEHHAEYMTYPRALAIAETMWSRSGKKNWNDFTQRVESQFARFDQAGINYAPSMYDPIITVKKDSQGKLVVHVDTEVSDLDVYYSLDNTIPNYYNEKYTEPIVLPDGTDIIRLVSFRGKMQKGRLITLTFEDLQKRVSK